MTTKYVRQVSKWQPKYSTYVECHDEHKYVIVYQKLIDKLLPNHVKLKFKNNIFRHQTTTKNVIKK